MHFNCLPWFKFSLYKFQFYQCNRFMAVGVPASTKINHKNRTAWAIHYIKRLSVWFCSRNGIATKLKWSSKFVV